MEQSQRILTAADKNAVLNVDWLDACSLMLENEGRRPSINTCPDREPCEK
jgi:hypothetical protein